MNDNPFAAPESNESLIEDQEGPRLSSRGRRLGAAIIDSIILSVINIPLLIALGLIDFNDPEGGGLSAQLQATLVGVTLFLLINGYFIFTRSQTIGKAMLKMVVVDKDSMQPIGGGRYVLRRLIPVWALSSIPLIGQLFALINALLIFRSGHNCLHDDIAGTRVVDKSGLLDS